MVLTWDSHARTPQKKATLFDPDWVKAVFSLT